ncbi:P-loop containing nucleoside triphosphate hydrolase protein [Delitschia confertaspora ATCC 74209]|uniref:ATP-dependent DNA helicase n=1 Tax=Delitschia confertaspora ATCC 74209 TaxID=1513339 RepID=A0A9P4JRA5_9PLEO|nr:P-loop containing nucleoside triphosphate hydrolase protein [Delitschia confertaspora ATCC 74209]
MDDSDEYGDFDDDEILAVATQVECGNGRLFQLSPRPQKRRRLDQHHHQPQQPQPQQQQHAPNHNIQNLPLRKAGQPTRRGPFGETSDEEEFGSEPSLPTIPTSHDSTVHGKRPDSSGKENRKELSTSKLGNKKSDRIHIPSRIEVANDLFLTQPPQLPSPPGRIRGAIWQKPAGNSRPMMSVHRPAGPPIFKSADQNVSRPSVTTEEQVVLKKNRKNGDSLDFDIAQELADLPSDAFESSSPPQNQGDELVVTSARRTRLVAPQNGLRQTTLFGREAEAVPASQVNKRYNFVASQKDEPPTHHKLDDEALKTWVYPTNLGTIRDYQFNIVARGLFHNLLVALPTGLGKTFIAATIMLNWFRWTRGAQIVFVAPTKPLVAQQVEACFGIVGIPRSQTSMLTGTIPPGLRAEEWANKRVFFMTPQTMINDLKTGICDPKKIVLLVVDEAHKATGAYAYVEVVKFIRRFNESFRVLALTATPGGDVESVQKVIDGLDISRVEIRTEQSLDIRNYVHGRTVEKHAFAPSDEMEMCFELYSQAVRPVLNKLNSQNASWTQNPTALTPFGCNQMRKKWMMEAGRHVNQGIKSMVNAIFNTLGGSLSQSMELLKYHGIRPFYNKLRQFRDDKENGKYKKEIVTSEAFVKLMNRLQSWCQSSEFTGHPKLDYLQEAILSHFVNASEGRGPDAPSHTRIMVFAHFRDSAEEIVRFLKRHEPMIRPHVFNGQANSHNSEGMDQKRQLEVLQQFKTGTYNTLVATSIGEEGLDIGEVDLIICYDSKASPIRMLQRMGRTGRKREGKIILLQMKGKEEDDYFKAKDSYEKIQEEIASGAKFEFHDDRSRRIVPRGIQPVVDKRVVEIPLENSQQDLLPEPKRRGRPPKRPPKKFHMPDGVITGFVTASRIDQGLVPKVRSRKKAAPVCPSEELVILPPLESVLLDDNKSKDLERRYQTIFDDDDAPIIDELNLGAYPERQRRIRKSKYFNQPGRASEAFVGMFKRMHSMDYEQLEVFKKNVRHSDYEDYPNNDMIVSDSDSANDEVEEFAPPSPKAKPPPRPRANPGPNPRAKAATAANKTITPRRQNFRISDLVAEGAESSPPPTDPRMRLASQAESLGSQDTVHSDALPDNTQAYRLDSDLRDFIASEDEEEVEQAPSSSLPQLNFGDSFNSAMGLGKGTQAVVHSAKKKQRGGRKLEKIFTSDVTDQGGVELSSDNEDDEVIPRANKRKNAVVIESETEGDEEGEADEPVRPVKRVRRVVMDDEDGEE